MFPYARHPGSVIFVDDDQGFVDVVHSVFSSKWNMKAFQRPREFIDHMLGKVAVAKDMEAYLQGSMERYKRKSSAAVEILRFWNAFPERYSMPVLAVLDYHMPFFNGLQTLENCVGWTGQNLLLTGMADEVVVSNAFNNGLIDYYMPKQDAKLIKNLEIVINKLISDPGRDSQRNWTAWYLSMQAEQNLILAEPDVSQELFRYVGPDSEHVVIGDPFGVMTLGHAGGVKWLQLETASTLDAAADLAIKMGLSSADAQMIRIGRAITDARIKHALGIDEPPTLLPATFQLRLPRANETVYGSSFVLNAAGAPPPEMCFAAWRARQH